MIYAFYISNLKFQNFKMTSDEKITYRKVVDLVVGKILI